MMSLALLFASAAAFTPAPLRSPRAVCRAAEPAMLLEQPTSRRSALAGVAAAAAFSALPAFASVTPEAYKLKKNYPSDAKLMLDNMRQATDLKRGDAGMEDIVKATRSEMNDFVAFYRRQPKVAGMPSFSTMYTAINTLSGHYASYGNKYPVPEKRKTRLQQQYKEIERALARGK
uniref:Photosystem II 11 kDa protein n=1 Tax=Prymnesium polylepis TaxID=72548 RepID=A0A7S4HCL4_9EUKA